MGVVYSVVEYLDIVDVVVVCVTKNILMTHKQAYIHACIHTYFQGCQPFGKKSKSST